MVGIVLLVLLLGYVLFSYNRLVELRESARNDLQQIDVQLDRRYKVFESLISAVSKYLDYEKTTLNDVVALRTQAKNAEKSGDDKTRFAAEGEISKIAGSLNVIVENYPDLKASQNVQKLMEEIVSTENKLSFAKQAYNDAVERLNRTIQKIPYNIFASSFGFEAFIYWKLSADDKKTKEDYTVKL